MIEKSEQINELAAALAKAQKAFKPVVKNKTAKIKMRSGGEYAYNYADLADAWNACRDALSTNDLSVSQPVTYDVGVLRVTTLLMHGSGQWIASDFCVPSNDGDMRTLGSVITYARRYALSSAIGLVTDDDTDQQERGEMQRSTPQPAATPVRAIPAQGGNRPIQRAEPGKAGDVSGKQAGYIKALREELGWDLDRLADYASTEAGIHTPLHNLTSWEASQLIKALESARDGVPYSYSKQEQPA